MSLSFPQKVIRLTLAIPPGRVLNYGRAAQLLENPRAARAVGYALSSLANGTDIPWHRVVGKAGARGVLTHPSGAAEQARRLMAEGLVFDEEGDFRLADYLWGVSVLEVRGILATTAS
jgi:methylated-DNA-protein-cysteine methyltransferase-like protein